MAANTWIILGASSAIARAFALEAATQGADIVLAGRDLADLETQAADLRIRTGTAATVLVFDARDTAAHVGFADTCDALAPDTLNLFLAFGIMPGQALTDEDAEAAEALVATNLLGAVTVLAAFAPLLERRGRGCVMALGSVAGDRGRIGNYLYGATKAGLHTYLQGYRARLSRRSMRVVTLKAGPVDTAMTWPLGRLPFVASPRAFARRAWALSRRGPVEAYVPGIWAPVMAIIRLVPTPIFNRMNI
jgi:NADP-dependent 3-hydroxy acid dehydrogenase YdfG